MGGCDAGVLVLLGIVLLVLWWHGDERVAPAAVVPTLTSSEDLPAALAAPPEPPPFVFDAGARALIEQPAVVASMPTPGAPVTTLHGRLVDPAGQGVQGTVHSYERPSGAGFLWQAGTRKRTAADGTFSVPLHVGTRSALVGSANGFSPSEAHLLEVVDALADVTLHLQSYTEIRGIVVDEQGAPRPGALLIGAGPSPDGEGAWLPWIPEMLMGLDGSRSSATRQVQCVPDGSFVFPMVIPRDRVILSYSQDAFAVSFVQWQDIRPGDRALRLVVRSDDLRCSSVSGTVRGPDGAPLTCCQIQVDGRFSHDVQDPDGRFEVRAQWGCEAPILVRPTVGQGGGISTTTSVSVPRGTAARDGPVHWVGTCRVDCEAQECGTLQLLPPGTLTVRVHDRAGKAVDEAALQLEMDAQATRGAAVWQPFYGWPITGETSPDGEAHLTGLGAGPYRVWVVANGRLIDTLTSVRSGAEQSLDVVVAAR